MEQEQVERYGGLAELVAERVEPGSRPPAVRVDGRTWQEWRQAHADARLREAAAAGADDSWWEEPDA